MTMTIDLESETLIEVDKELMRSRAKHGPMRNVHEAYAVILEEFEEFWDEVKAQNNVRSKTRMREELIQVAAMAVRTIEDLELK